MPDWTAFALATVTLTLLLLVLTRRSRHVLERVPVRDGAGVPTAEEAADGVRGAETTAESELVRDGATADERIRPGRPAITTRALLANVAVSQVAFLAALGWIAWWTGVPAAAFGLTMAAVGVEAVGYGVVAGAVLYVANEIAAAVGERFGFSAPEWLREALAPTTAAEWVLLLVVVLPVIAIFEEALFRGALIGALSVGFGIDPWLLAAVSAVGFGLGHGAQGRIGVVVTGGLGFALAALFVASGNLLVVIVAHYVINVLEFVVREGLAWEPFAERA